jgi:hypothetical protein
MGTLIEELQKDTEEIKTIPICTSCKKIRDDNGSWNHKKAYIREHYHAEFIDGTCPECAKIFIWNQFNNQDPVKQLKLLKQIVKDDLF